MINGDKQEKRATGLVKPKKVNKKKVNKKMVKKAHVKKAHVKKAKKEVEIESIILMKFTNIAMTNPYDNNRFPASNALSDGKSFCHTAKGKGMFWRGMFKNGAHVITQVRVRNRGDCCGQRLSGALIKIGDEVCGSIPEKTQQGKWYTVECKSPINGDFVKVEMAKDDYLHISGIEVYGQRKVKAAKVKGGSEFKVESAGRKMGNYSRITLNGKIIKTSLKSDNGSRGMNVVAIEPRTHNIVLKKSYDTYGSNGASNEMLKDLKELAKGTVIVIGIKDEGTRKLSKKLKKYLAKMGSKEVHNLVYR